MGQRRYHQNAGVLVVLVQSYLKVDTINYPISLESLDDPSHILVSIKIVASLLCDILENTKQRNALNILFPYECLLNLHIH